MAIKHSVTATGLGRKIAAADWDQNHVFNGTVGKLLGADGAEVDPSTIGGAIGFTPEKYGALGNGTTDDTTAFQNLAAAINTAGGGVVDMKPGATYLVGRQTYSSTSTVWRYAPDSICLIRDCTKPVIIRGNGAKMLMAGGQRYGVFNADGTPNYTASGYTPVGGERASLGAYIPNNGSVGSEGLLTIINCTGAVAVVDLELDGNNANAIMGGMSGDTGWQVPGDGLIAFNNSGGEYFRNLKVHNNMRDGGLGWRETNTFAENLPKVMTIVDGCDFYNNGRQGWSLTGGRGYLFRGSRFRRTGRTVNTSIPSASYGNQQMSSAPAAGVDIEVEQSQIRDIYFEQCEFGDTVGCAFVADSGDSSFVSFRKCTFIGTTNWSFWSSKPNFVMEECRFFGALNPAYENTVDPTKSLQFIRCLFSDRAKYAPSGTTSLYSGGINGGGGSFGRNTLYQLCQFDFGSGAGSPLGSIFDTCYLTAGNISLFSPRFRGYNTIRLNQIGQSFAGNASNYKIETGQVAAYDPSGLSSTRTSTATTDTLVLADNGGRVEYTNAGAVTVTVPSNASVAFPVGATIEIRRSGGPVTVVAGAGVLAVFNDPGSGNTTIEQVGTLMVLTQTSANLWTFGPALAVAAVYPAPTGYTNTGGGGTVTQGTSKSTGVTLNKLSGQITLNAASLAANAAVSFVFTNSNIAATDVMRLNVASGAATPSSYLVQAEGFAAGTVNISVRNLTAGALAEALVLNFVIIKSVNA